MNYGKNKGKKRGGPSSARGLGESAGYVKGEEQLQSIADNKHSVSATEIVVVDELKEQRKPVTRGVNDLC